MQFHALHALLCKRSMLNSFVFNSSRLFGKPPGRGGGTKNKLIDTRTPPESSRAMLATSCVPHPPLSDVAHCEKVEQLSPQGYVNDFAGVIDADSRTKLTALCQELTRRPMPKSRRHHPFSRGRHRFDFANRLFQKWGVDQKARIAAS